MIYVEDLLKDLTEFIDFFIMKYKYENRGIVKKFRMKSGLNKDLSEDKWCQMFITKSAINHCCKILLIKVFEDKNKVLPKLNNEGFEHWSEMVVDLDSQYNNIYNIALKDILTVAELRRAFKISDYDVYEIDNELASYIINKLLNYEFKNITGNELNNIARLLYLNNQNIEYFYKPCPAIEFIKGMEEKKEILI
ncbi:hypothetical protein GOQ27_01490 [Clostridium sp. D2Q-11]|uniref:Uncharacterized protein n=1 Tax=Anaeromonas frigoriresistens TaxID=2683708 RepID=A0A942Z7P7_9FIRM|nr:hypothetical protein [Anaeromonas frigoriresistens]MBS4537114.1 hypothetical protein [Anaeromonas frigoriresistens]